MKVNNPIIKVKKELDKKEWLRQYKKDHGFYRTNINIITIDHISLIDI